MSMSLRCAISSTESPTGASTSRRVPSRAMNVIFGISIHLPFERLDVLGVRILGASVRRRRQILGENSGFERRALDRFCAEIELLEHGEPRRLGCLGERPLLDRAKRDHRMGYGPGQL